MNLNKTQMPESCLASVKSRFFAQYWGQNYIYKNEYGKFKGNLSDENSIYHFKNHLKNNNPILLLKSLSKITDEDASKIPYRNSSDDIIGYYTAKSLNKNIECIGFYTNEEIDNLRLLGYAVPFMEHSVEDLVSFGWVQLL